MHIIHLHVNVQPDHQRVPLLQDRSNTRAFPLYHGSWDRAHAPGSVIVGQALILLPLALTVAVSSMADDRSILLPSSPS